MHARTSVRYSTCTYSRGTRRPRVNASWVTMGTGGYLRPSIYSDLNHSKGTPYIVPSDRSESTCAFSPLTFKEKYRKKITENEKYFIKCSRMFVFLYYGASLVPRTQAYSLPLCLYTTWPISRSAHTTNDDGPRALLLPALLCALLCVLRIVISSHSTGTQPSMGRTNHRPRKVVRAAAIQQCESPQGLFTRDVDSC